MARNVDDPQDGLDVEIDLRVEVLTPAPTRQATASRSQRQKLANPLAVVLSFFLSDQAALL
jgi:hypothetical protein